MNSLNLAIDEKCKAEGLVFLGVTDLELGKSYEKYSEWISRHKHAGMDFMARYQEVRRDPKQLLAGAKSAVLLGLPYYLGDVYSLSEPPRAAQYARLKDYHKILKKKGGEVARVIGDRFPGEATRVLVDSAPVLERALAAKTSRGFIGKNTCYIDPERGSFILLAEILTSAAIAADDKVPVFPDAHGPNGGCGKCNRCQVKCPTGALSEAYQLDANLCLAYWTIEHRGPIPEKFWPWLKYYYFGCDICQLVCPYNKKKTKFFKPAQLEERNFPGLYETAVMNEAEYLDYFSGTPMTRAKRNGLRRNALIALAVTQSSRLLEALALAEKDDAYPIRETITQIRNYMAPGNY